MTSYWVEFERIGRARNIPPLKVEYRNDPDEVALQVFRFAKSKLASHHFSVEVNMDELTGNIAGGRFGNFKLTVVDTATQHQ